MNYLISLKEGLRMYKRARKVKKVGFHKFEGSPDRICEQIIESCWNGKYFQVSSGHFCEFYMRDFGWCVDSLIYLGYRQRSTDTIKWALSVYAHQGRLATTITPEGKVVDFFKYSPDTLGFLLRTLHRLDAKDIVHEYRYFIDEEVKRFMKLAVDERTGMIRKDKYFSSMKDHSKRKSSCYDNCFLPIISNALDYFGLHNPLKPYNYEKLIKHHFWHGTHFLDDMTGQVYVTGDANIFPFWLGIYSDKKMLKQAIHSIQISELDKPVPLRYFHKKDIDHEMVSAEIFAKDYERDTVWAHMGMLYIDVVSKMNKKLAKDYLFYYSFLINKYGTFLEVYTPDTKPYQTRFYVSDEGMLWAVNYLALAKKLKL